MKTSIPPLVLACSGLSPEAARNLESFLRDEAAVTSIEYALLASLIAMVAVIAISSLGVNLSLLWQKVADTVTGAV